MVNSKHAFWQALIFTIIIFIIGLIFGYFVENSRSNGAQVTLMQSEASFLDEQIRGTIIQNSGGSIVGITTAASIWVAAAIGMSIGIGFYFAAGTATFLAILAIYFMHGIEKKYIRGEKSE